MTRLEKIELAIEKGYTCNPETGDVFNINKQKVGYKNGPGYMEFGVRYGLRKDNKVSFLRIHQFVYYCVYNKIVDMIDHIDRDKTNNSIYNLRESTPSKNQMNTINKGTYYDKRKKRYRSSICVDGKCIFLGLFKTYDEAHQKYLDAKKTHHII